MFQQSSNDPAAMDQPASFDQSVGQQYRKPEFNIYSMFLVVSFLFNLTAAIIVYIYS